MRVRIYLLLFAIAFHTILQNAHCGLVLESSVSSHTSEEYIERQENRNRIILQIEEATRRRCPHVKIGNKVIALCHGEERWSKKIDCDHQQLFQFSDFYHQNIKNTVCSADMKIFKKFNFIVMGN